MQDDGCKHPVYTAQLNALPQPRAEQEQPCDMSRDFDATPQDRHIDTCLVLGAEIPPYTAIRTPRERECVSRDPLSYHEARSVVPERCRRQCSRLTAMVTGFSVQIKSVSRMFHEFQIEVTPPERGFALSCDVRVVFLERNGGGLRMIDGLWPGRRGVHIASEGYPKLGEGCGGGVVRGRANLLKFEIAGTFLS